MTHTAKFARIASVALAIFSLTAIVRAQSVPPSPPAPPAPPSATIPTPGVPQFAPMPVIEMNAPANGGAPASASGTSGLPGASVLVLPMQQPSSSTVTEPAPARMLAAGTPLLLALQRSIHLRTAHIGDPVYLRTEFPVAAGHHVAIPAGSYVRASLLAVRLHSAGLRLTQLILPSGAVLTLPATASGTCRIWLRAASGVVPRGRRIDTCLPHAVTLPQPQPQPQPQPEPPLTSPSTIPVPILVQPPAFNTNSFSKSGTASSGAFIKK
jgi:hypothetical protein